MRGITSIALHVPMDEIGMTEAPFSKKQAGSEETHTGASHKADDDANAALWMKSSGYHGGLAMISLTFIRFSFTTSLNISPTGLSFIGLILRICMRKKAFISAYTRKISS